MRKPKIKITVVDQLGNHKCHRGHKIGDVFDYDTERGKICPMAIHVIFPSADILRYGGTPPKSKSGDILLCCPDVDVLSVFKLEAISRTEE